MALADLRLDIEVVQGLGQERRLQREAGEADAARRLEPELIHGAGHRDARRLVAETAEVGGEAVHRLARRAHRAQRLGQRLRLGDAEAGAAELDGDGRDARVVRRPAQGRQRLAQGRARFRIEEGGDRAILRQRPGQIELEGGAFGQVRRSVAHGQREGGDGEADHDDEPADTGEEPE